LPARDPRRLRRRQVRCHQGKVLTQGKCDERAVVGPRPSARIEASGVGKRTCLERHAVGGRTAPCGIDRILMIGIELLHCQREPTFGGQHPQPRQPGFVMAGVVMHFAEHQHVRRPRGEERGPQA
jgi:hypothetical protein